MELYLTAYAKPGKQSKSVSENPAADLSELSNWSLRINQNGDLHVYVHVDQVNDSIIKNLHEAGLSLENSNAKMRVVQGWVNYTLLDIIAEIQGVRHITPPAYAMTNSGSITTEGDAILESDDLRSTLSVTGNGVKIGVISDGVDHWTDVKASPYYDLPNSRKFFIDC